MTGVAGHTVLAFLIAVATSLLLMPIAITLAARYRLVVRPRFFKGSRSRRRIPYLGGVSVAAATVLAIVVATGLNRTTFIVLGAALAILAIGYLDNLRSGPRAPLTVIALVQMAAASIVWSTEFRQALPGGSGWFMTVLLLVGSANAFNLLDNMNGVAAYTALGTAGGLALLAFMGGTPETAIVAAAVGGAAAGFVPFNHKRAKMYLGAGGPEFIGFLLAYSALQVGLYFGPRWAPVAAVVALGVPATDTTLTLLNRAAHGRPMFRGAIDHISHRLFRMGFSTLRAARMHGWAAVIATGAVGVGLYLGPVVLLATIAAFAAAATALGMMEGREPIRRRHGLPLVRYLAWGFVILIALSVPPSAAAALDLRNARDEFLAGRQQAMSFNSVGARAAFARGGELAARAERRLNWPLTRPARLLPVVGDNIRAVDALASGGKLLGPAAQTALDAAEVFPVGPDGPEIGFSEGKLNTDPWPRAAESLSQAAIEARLALADARAAGGLLLPPIQGAREQFLAQGEAAVQALEKASDAATLLPHFFADGTKRTWFLAIQNPVELRATGGFLGAFGILTAEDGALSLERFASNNDLPVVDDPVTVSDEFADNYDRFYSRTFWLNANMTPDFPTAASVLAKLWESGTGTPIDGVIAIDAVGLNYLLGVVGPVDVDPVGPITSEIYLPLALNEAYIRYPEKNDRSEFLLEVGLQVWARMLAGNFSDPSTLLAPMGDLVTTKRIQIWSPDQIDRLKRLGLAGELRPEEDADYLMVIGQNAGGNKLDYYARRQIAYSVDLTNPALVTGQISLVIDNQVPANADLPTYIVGPSLPQDYPGLNRTFASIYLPGSTQITSAMVDGSPSGVESYTELGLGVAAKFLEIAPQTSSSLSLQTQLQLPEPGHYKLVLQRQPVLNPDQVTIDITLPPGAFVHSHSPELTVVGNHLRWSGELHTEMVFEVRYGSSLGGGRGSALARR